MDFELILGVTILDGLKSNLSSIIFIFGFIFYILKVKIKPAQIINNYLRYE
jgi:hypothetical protein